MTSEKNKVILHIEDEPAHAILQQGIPKVAKDLWDDQHHES